MPDQQMQGERWFRWIRITPSVGLNACQGSRLGSLSTHRCPHGMHGEILSVQRAALLVAIPRIFSSDRVALENAPKNMLLPELPARALRNAGIVFRHFQLLYQDEISSQ